jgi:hypothetical protein
MIIHVINVESVVLSISAFEFIAPDGTQTYDKQSFVIDFGIF